MTQEQKDLLLKDLCARLPYGVKVAFLNEDLTHHSDPKTLIRIECINNLNYSRLEDEDGNTTIVEFVKPYLLPISSMTEEQKVEFDKMAELDMEYTITQIKNDSLIWTSGLNRYNWLIKNHFDVYDLIPMGLANDATGLNIY